MLKFEFDFPINRDEKNKINYNAWQCIHIYRRMTYLLLFFFIFKYIYELNICNIFLKIATEYSIRINYLFSYYNFFTYFFAN
jgi:hypothetical protein